MILASVPLRVWIVVGVLAAALAAFYLWLYLDGGHR